MKSKSVYFCVVIFFSQIEIKIVFFQKIELFQILSKALYGVAKYSKILFANFQIIVIFHHKTRVCSNRLERERERER